MNAHHVSATDSLFIHTLETWLQNREEILLLIRYSHAAGSKDFEFFTSPQSLISRICELPPRTSIIAFRKPHLPFRGIVDDDFIAKCLSSIPDGTEYLVVETVRRVYGQKSWFHHAAGKKHAELKDDLEQSRGTSVVAGAYPDWMYDNESVISAIVPDADGKIQPGVY